MNKRYDKIGIKQALRLEWLEYTLELVRTGIYKKEIRDELKAYMAYRKDDGSFGERGKETTNIAVTMLMNIWGDPGNDILQLKNELLKVYNQKNSLAVHWAMTTAAYPFWFRIAEQVGRLLKLQDKITKKQIVERIKESYGDRSSVIRSAQRVVQAFVSWNVLAIDKNNCYHLSKKNIIEDTKVIALLYETALLTNPNGKAQLNMLQNSPAFFPFTLPIIPGETIVNNSEHLNISRYSIDAETIYLKQ